ncbi:MAG: arylsulfatase, partial [Phycisphaeraceae bacterium]|nr:arylsulfatase [Phycisphaeraceae bacterium]
MAEAPDIILITSDQQRGDCLGIEGHPALQTPNLDHLGASGTRFRRAYAESPSCIPARRSLMTGTAPAAHGMVGFRDGVAWNPAHTLAGTLARAGYETVMIGKLHLWPRRRPFGFERMLLADWTGDDGHNDYVRWLRREHGVIGVDPAMAHGVSPNSWVSRPHHLPETQMHTFWCIEEAMRFLQQREGRRPLFLN